jgi:hypothetical protein
MKRAILYYPTIDILRHALLYYDEVSSIVPQSYGNRNLAELSPEIKYLLDENQFRAVTPDTLLYNNTNFDSFQEFSAEFNSIVSSKSYRRRIELNYGMYYGNNKGRLSYKFSKIHVDKISVSAFQSLRTNGLALESNGEDWVSFEENTALLYMSLLAKYLADVDTEQMTVGTNNLLYENLNFKKVSKSRGFPVVSINLEKILPSPSDNVSYQDIISFKRKRKDNLDHFKGILADFQKAISKAESRGEVADTSMGFRERISNGVNDLSAAMSDSRIETLFKGFKVLINKDSLTPWLTAATFANQSLKVVSIPQFLNVIGVGLVGALEVGTFFVEELNKRRAVLRDSPFSYLYYAKKAKILDRARV